MSAIAEGVIVEIEGGFLASEGVGKGELGFGEQASSMKAIKERLCSESIDSKISMRERPGAWGEVIVQMESQGLRCEGRRHQVRQVSNRN
jgi:hypothetical protein